MRTAPANLAILAAAMLAGLSGACDSGPPSEPERPPGARRLLFIGNSLTYYNDMPGLVEEIALADGLPLEVASIALPNTAVIDFAGQSSVHARIAQGGWDAVILQQGPTTPGVCRDTLVMGTIALDRSIRAAGGRTATLMTWPYEGYPDAFTWVHESAKRASDAVNGLFLPAGDAWVAAWRMDRSLRLYGPDGYHPSLLGSLLTALVVYEGVTGRDVRLLSSSIPIASYSGVTLRTLQQAAHEAVSASVSPTTAAPSAVSSAAMLRSSC
jgi:hypothetical protein